MTITTSKPLSLCLNSEKRIRQEYNDWGKSNKYSSIMDSWSYTAPSKLEELSAGLYAETLLDVACGNGRLGYAFSKSRPNIEIDGVDISFEMIKNCPKPLYRDLHIASVNRKKQVQKELNPKKYDAIISCGAIGDLITPHCVDFLLDFIKPKGWFAIAGAQRDIGDRIPTNLGQIACQYARRKGFEIQSLHFETGYHWYNIVPVRYAFIVGVRE